MSLRLTNAADYAILAMIHLACRPEESLSLRRDIARSCHVPPSFLAKVLRSLVHADLVRSIRGAQGGFRLARPTTEITLLEIVNAIEGPPALTQCTEEHGDCVWSDDCPARSVLCRVQREVATILGGHTLEMLVSTRRKNGRIAV